MGTEVDAVRCPRCGEARLIESWLSPLSGILWMFCKACHCTWQGEPPRRGFRLTHEPAARLFIFEPTAPEPHPTLLA